MSGHNAKKSIKAATGSGSLLVVVVNRGQSEQRSQLKLELLPSLHTYIGVMKSSFGLLLLLFKSNRVLVPTSQILDIIKRIQTWVFKAAYANTGKVENLHGHVNFNLQYVNLDLHSL